MIPMNMAQALNIRLNPSDFDIYAIRTASGIAPIYRFKGYVLTKVIVNDRDTPLIPLSLIISESMDQVILSDKAISALGIVIINAGEGIWCFNDELGKVLRESCVEV